MLKYDESGQGLPVILIHGFPLCRQMWRPQMSSLVAAGYRVVCPDLPGFGESPLPDGRVSVTSYADAVIDLLDELKIEKAVIGGMSMGGYVLLNLANRHSGRLLGAMFLVTRAAADDAAGKAKRTLLAEEVSRGNHLIVPETFAKILFAPETHLKNPDLIADVSHWMASTSPEGIVGGLLAMRERVDSVAALGNIKLPSLVVGAELDMAVPPEHSRLLAECLPDADLKIIAGAGHMANLEKPEDVNRALLEFLGRLK